MHEPMRNDAFYLSPLLHKSVQLLKIIVELATINNGSSSTSDIKSAILITTGSYRRLTINGSVVDMS